MDYDSIRPHSLCVNIDVASNKEVNYGIFKSSDGRRVKKIGAVKNGDTVVLTSGEPMGEPGGTNTLKIIHVK